MDDREFLTAFDAGTLDPSMFSHALHVRAAWLCLHDDPVRDGMARLRRGLKQLAIRAGHPGHYHETITVAFARLIQRRMRELGPHTYDEFVRRAPEFFSDGKAVLAGIYDEATLASDEARHRFVPPASWNSRLVDRFLDDFAQQQADAEVRREQGGLPDMAEPDAHGAEPVSAMAVLAVSSVEASIDWYARVFGFDATPYPERPPYTMALLSKGGAEVMLRQASAAVTPPAGWALRIRLAGGSIRALHDGLRASADMVTPLRRMPYHDVEFEVRDPDGYVIAVSEWVDQADDVPGVEAADLV
jgi:uncharacterized glyoxalase superfamily protein PhnB